MDVKVYVINQELKVATNIKERLAEGSHGFVRFIFDMSEDWDDLTVFAQFVQGRNGYNQYLDENNAAFLPSEIGAGNCYLLLRGTNENVIATTNYLKMTVNETGYIENATVVNSI